MPPEKRQEETADGENVENVEKLEDLEAGEDAAAVKGGGPKDQEIQTGGGPTN